MLVPPMSGQSKSDSSSFAHSTLHNYRSHQVWGDGSSNLIGQCFCLQILCFSLSKEPLPGLHHDLIAEFHGGSFCLRSLLPASASHHPTLQSNHYANSGLFCACFSHSSESLRRGIYTVSPYFLLPLIYAKTKGSLCMPHHLIPCTHHLICRQMKPFKYLFTMSSVSIRPCHSCHAPHVSLKHNVINTSSALMDASHMNALMKCVIVFPHRTLTIYLRLCLRSPAELLKTTSYQMSPQFHLSDFKFKFITEALLVWEEDTSLWGLQGPASITIKSNSGVGNSCRDGWQGTRAALEGNPV